MLRRIKASIQSTEYVSRMFCRRTSSNSYQLICKRWAVADLVWPDFRFVNLLLKLPSAISFMDSKLLQKRPPRIGLNRFWNVIQKSPFERTPEVDRFFQLLGDLLRTHNFSANRIFNCDESGLPTVPTTLQKVVAQKCSRRVPKVTSAERGRNVNIVCSMNAAGYFIPPVFIFARKRFRNELLVGAPPDSDGFCNESGWMNNAKFIQYLHQYLQHFTKHTRPSYEDQILLIVDNHASHISLEAVDFCWDKS